MKKRTGSPALVQLECVRNHSDLGTAPIAAKQLKGSVHSERPIGGTSQGKVCVKGDQMLKHYLCVCSVFRQMSRMSFTAHNLKEIRELE